MSAACWVSLRCTHSLRSWIEFNSEEPTKHVYQQQMKIPPGSEVLPENLGNLFLKMSSVEETMSLG